MDLQKVEQNFRRLIFEGRRGHKRQVQFDELMKRLGDFVSCYNLKYLMNLCNIKSRTLGRGELTKFQYKIYQRISSYIKSSRQCFKEGTTVWFKTNPLAQERLKAIRDLRDRNRARMATNGAGVGAKSELGETNPLKSELITNREIANTVADTVPNDGSIRDRVQVFEIVKEMWGNELLTDTILHYINLTGNDNKEAIHDLTFDPTKSVNRQIGTEEKRAYWSKFLVWPNGKDGANEESSGLDKGALVVREFKEFTKNLLVKEGIDKPLHKTFEEVLDLDEPIEEEEA
jgi:hypothetical protein